MSLQWIRWQWGAWRRKTNAGSKFRGLSSRPRIESLEQRELLAGAVPAVTGSGGSPIIAEVATISNSDVLAGSLSPLSDTGVSDTDEITAINQPTFDGTAQPYSIVQLFGRRTDQAQPVLLGQAVTSPAGNWQLSVGALPDGVYSFTVAQIPTTGFVSTMAAVTPSSVVIDTAPPTVVCSSITRNSDQINIVFEDALSGLDTASLSNPSDYALLGPSKTRIQPSSVTIVPNASVRTTDPVTVILQFNGLGRIHGARTIALGGIADLAGNPLPKEYLEVTQVIPGIPGAPPQVRVNAQVAHARHHRV